MDNIKYFSTRGENKAITASQAILKGIADDGGLFVPEKIPQLDIPLEKALSMSYQNLAYEVLKLFLTDYTKEELEYCIQNAYDSKFDTEEIAPVAEADGNYFLELFHGRTLAFKDMALSILPHLMITAAKKNNLDKKILILTATSGDTGKAALEGFANVENTAIAVFYPENGVSPIQRLQMTTQEGNNTYVAAVKGNFDDCQNTVKKIFMDKEITDEIDKKGYVFSSANSINIGRLLPQIVYYFYGYAQLVKKGVIKCGDKINFTVPTGNFGNILAGYYAKKMGLPVNKLICASNSNKVLFDFFQEGEYDKNRDFILTISPSMDILISSNLERLLYHLSNDCAKTSELMQSLNNKGKYTFDINTDEFAGEFTTEDETLQAINKVYKKGYTIDTHTAVAFSAYEKYVQKTGDTTPNITVSTASPFKFATDVCKAIDERYADKDPFVLLEELAVISGVEVPQQIKDINKRKVHHDKVCTIDGAVQFVLECC